jgi:hypothetical protein
MKKLLKVLLLSLLFSFSVYSQNTNVTATITDSGGQSWNNGTYTFNFIPAPRLANGPYRLNGSPYTPVPITGSLSSTGTFTSVPVPDNNLITPSGTLWSVTVCIQANYACFTSNPLTITGASQTITSSVIPPALSVTCGANIIAYLDSEVSCGIGGSYYNLTSQSIRVCQTVVANVCTVWGGNGAPPNAPVSPAQQQGPAYNVRNFGAVGDAKSSNNCSFTNTTQTITNTDNPWLVSDIGKKLQAAASSGASIYGTPPTGTEVTITGFNSAGSITVNTVSGTTSVGTCVWYTQQDTATMFAAYTAADCGVQKAFQPAYSSPTLCRPGSVFIPKGGYVVCGTIYNDILHAGNNTEGVSLKGESGTDIYVAPCFVPPNASASVGTLILAYLNQGAEFGPFHITGMGFLNTNLSANQYLFGTLSSGTSWIHDVTIGQWGTNQGSNAAAFGMVSGSGLSRIDNLQVQNAPGGDASIGCLWNNVGVDIFNSFCSNHFINGLIINSGRRTPVGNHFVMHGFQGDECGTNGLACFQVQNSTINCLGCEFLNPGGGVGSLSLDTTSIAYFTESQVTTFNTDTGNASGVILAGNAQIFATGSDFNGNNASAAVAGPNTSRFWDLGGNRFNNQVAGVLTPCTIANIFTCGFSGGVTPTFPLASGSTTQLGNRQTVATGTGTASPTFAVTGFGTGPTVTIEAGSTDAAGSVTITAGTTPTAIGTFTVTFSTVAGVYGTNPPVCTFTLVNGTGSWNALAQEPIIQTKTTTSVVANWSNNAVNLTAASTYGFNWSCYGK